MPKLTNKCAICGKPILKSWTICDECREKQRHQEEEINIEIAKTRAKLIPEILWEKRRYEIAKDIFSRCLSHEDGDVRAFCNRELDMTAEDCVRQANALIKALRKEVKE